AGAVPAQHVELVAHGAGAPRDVAQVGVLRDESQRSPLTTPADHDRRTARLQWPRHVARLRDAVVATVEARSLLTEHGATDLHRLLEPVHSLAHRREGEPEAL